MSRYVACGVGIVPISLFNYQVRVRLMSRLLSPVYCGANAVHNKMEEFVVGDELCTLFVFQRSFWSLLVALWDVSDGKVL